MAYKAKCKAKQHNWRYRGGECRCTKCGYYMSPTGKITKKAS